MTNIDVDYILTSGIWSFSGLLAGYALGKIECHMQREKLREEERRDDT